MKGVGGEEGAPFEGFGWGFNGGLLGFEVFGFLAFGGLRGLGLEGRGLKREEGHFFCFF